MELKLMNVRLRGCAFTLFPAAKNAGVDEKKIHNLLTMMYKKLGYFSSNETMEKLDAENPNFPDAFSVSDFDNSEIKLEDLLEAGLVSQSGDEVSLQEKAINILKEAAKIQSDLDAKGFYFCPCHLIF